jgi:hypothetical protein
MFFHFIGAAKCTNPLISHCTYLYKNTNDDTYYLSRHAPPNLFPDANRYPLLSADDTSLGYYKEILNLTS